MKEKKKRGESSSRLRIMLIFGIVLGIGILIFIGVGLWSATGDGVILPSFLYVITGYDINFDNCHVRVGIDTYAIWQPVDRTVGDAVRETIGITIDGYVIPRQNILVGQYAILVTRFDEAGNEIGNHGGGVYVCFTAPSPLSPGQHTAIIRFESNGGTVYAHEWTFTVPDS